jgi:hypothetical protein
MIKIWISRCSLTAIYTIRTSTSSFFSSSSLISSFSFFFFFSSIFSFFFFFAIFFVAFFFLFHVFFSSFSFSLSQQNSNRMRFSTKHDFERRRKTFSSQKNENRSWWRRENVWANERKHRTHSHRYHARSNASKRRFKKINVVDQNTSKHLQFNERYFQEFSWNSRIDRIDVERRRDFFSHSSVRVLAVSSIFEETAFCAFTRRDDRHFERRWRRSKSAWEFVAKRHKTQNQFAIINHRYVINKSKTFLQSCKQH